ERLLRPRAGAPYRGGADHALDARLRDVLCRAGTAPRGPPAVPLRRNGRGERLTLSGAAASLPVSLFLSSCFREFRSLRQNGSARRGISYFLRSRRSLWAASSAVPDAKRTAVEGSGTAVNCVGSANTKSSVIARSMPFARFCAPNEASVVPSKLKSAFVPTVSVTSVTMG